METTITLTAECFWGLMALGIIGGIIAGVVTLHMFYSGEFKED